MVYTWHAASIPASALTENIMQEAEVGSKKIGLLKTSNAMYAFAATCPHSGAPLCTGWLDARGRIVCPLHKYKFDPKNGYNTTGEGYKLRTYKVDVREDIIFIGLIKDDNDQAASIS
jgi:nitrite reductase/ring-hydroxylating ferredoxin subunit